MTVTTVVIDCPTRLRHTWVCPTFGGVGDGDKSLQLRVANDVLLVRNSDLFLPPIGVISKMFNN